MTLDDGKEVSFFIADYNSIQLGYATTVHKSQGMTVDEAYVLATSHFDRHTTYVVMSRYKHNIKLYAAKEDFKNCNCLFNALGKKGSKVSVMDIVEQ